MATGTKNILVLNAGSSSTKVSLYQFDESVNANQSLIKETVAQQPIWQMEVDFPKGESTSAINWQKVLDDAVASLGNIAVGADCIRPGSPSPRIDIVGHRVVHGGTKYSCSVVIDTDVKQDIKDCIKLAPLHNKTALAQIEAMEKLLPVGTQQVAVFDTAFHHTLSEAVKFYPVPYAWYEKYGIRRFGFHGINYQYCTQQAANLIEKDAATLSLIVCHLGAGCSLAAIENGKSVNTTMGFTPMDGLMMASRSGSIDPGILLYLLKNENITVDQIEEDLNKNSGLKGISQSSGDMKTIIEKMQSGNNEETRLAKLAFTMFIEHLRASICAMRASLKKLDALVFTAGIGEHSSLVRQIACANLGFLGLQLDEKANHKVTADQNIIVDQNIASTKSQSAILIIKAREDWEIARQCLQVTSR